ncbi:MAG: metallophosphoesterase [Pseudorhodobacter sp.]|nr:metallophosphoesterase [Frankiaceae bacterium]
MSGDRDHDPLTAPAGIDALLPNPGRLVAVAGDWHGNDVWARNVLRSVAARGVRVVLQLGDFGVWPGDEGTLFLDEVQRACQDHDVTVCFLDGNHEDFDQLEAANRRDDGVAEMRPRVWHLPRASRWTWNGVGFAALGGATSLDVEDRTAYVSWWPQEALRPHQHQRLVDRGPVGVLLTHDCPSGSRVPGLSDRWRPTSLDHARRHRAALQQTVERVAPHLLLHGHFHAAYRNGLPLADHDVSVIGLDCDGTAYDRNVVLLDLAELAADIDAARAGRAPERDHGLLPPSLSAAVDAWSLRQTRGAT